LREGQVRHYLARVNQLLAQADALANS